MNSIASPETETPLARRQRNNAAMKLIVIAGLVLVGLVPLSLIRSVLLERKMRHREAIENITSTWGNAQTIAGPVLVIPYYRQVKVWKEQSVAGRTERVETTERVLGRAYFLPDEIVIEGDLKPERLHRSIYEAIVFRSSLKLSGRFAPPSFEDLKVTDTDVQWNEAVLMMSITDLRGANQTLWLEWGDERIPLVPGGAALTIGPVVHARVPGVSARSKPLAFKLAFSVNGSESLRFAPFGMQNRVRLTSSFPDPSFQGSFLPAHRKVTPAGFEADWEVSYYGRAYPQRWSDLDPDPFRGEAFQNSLFGVTVVPVVDSYRLVERSIKYGILFLALVFSGFFIFEVRWPVRVHPVQYTLVGSALCLFYLALLSLSEVISFGLAYLVGAGASTFLVAGYSAFMLGAVRKASAVGLGLAAIYGYIYIILLQQDYALLYGTAALFAVLAAAMYATRNINWYETQPPAQKAGDTP
jgi:inner membrane protein